MAEPGGRSCSRAGGGLQYSADAASASRSVPCRPPAPCLGDPHNCGLLLSSWESHCERCAKAGISGPKAVVSAMAVGLVIDVQRNGPVEDMYCAKRGPSDAAMFAESTSLHDQAIKALAAGDRPIGLRQFEDHLLDRGRPWVGTGGKTLKDFGYRFLGQYRRHVKDHISTLLDLSHHTCVADPARTPPDRHRLRYGRNHKGMPKWRVDRASQTGGQGQGQRPDLAHRRRI